MGTASELTAAVKRGFIYQGQRSAWQEHARGTPTRGFPAAAFISFIQNHDQVANSATGQRIHQLTSPARYRAMTALWLLSPQTPLLFQGQEFAASSPFLFFADFTGDMARPWPRGAPSSCRSFRTWRAKKRSKYWRIRAIRKFSSAASSISPSGKKIEPIYDLHIDLLKMRHEDPVLIRQSAEQLETAVLSADCLVVRLF